MDKETIKNSIEEFMKMLGFEISAEVGEDAGVVEVNLSADDAKMLIGEKGHNLESLECVLRVFLAAKLKEPLRLSLDVNSYRKQKMLIFREMAQKAAKKAKLFRRNIILNPMSASERRAVHIELSTDPDIATESVGEGAERRVVVKPRS